MRARYQRPSKPITLRPTPDDDQILFHVYRHRLIDKDMLHRLLPHRGEQGMGRRLRKLMDAHYLIRPPQQEERNRIGGGSYPKIYALDNFGAARLSEVHQAKLPSTRWRERNKDLRGKNIWHTLNTTRFLVDVAVAAREHAGVSLVYSDQLPQKGATQGVLFKNSQQSIRTQIDWNGHFGIEGAAADSLFAIEEHDRPKGRNRRHYFVEIDQGTETIVPGKRQQKSRAFFRDSSILRKYVTYASMRITGAQKSRFEFNNFRVLFVTTNAARLQNFIKAYQDHMMHGRLSVRPDTFLFLDWDTWRKRNPSQFVCLDGRGDSFRVF